MGGPYGQMREGLEEWGNLGGVGHPRGWGWPLEALELEDRPGSGSGHPRGFDLRPVFPGSGTRRPGIMRDSG
jgi:hypothetical protein